MKLSSLLLAIALVLSQSTVSAAEITPIFGLRGGGEFIDLQNSKKYHVVSSKVYGLILSFPYERGKTTEVYYSHQSTDLSSSNISSPTPAGGSKIPFAIDYLHLGGTAPIIDEQKLKTFLSGGLGFSYLRPDISGVDADLRFSLNIGLGMKYRLSKNIALRIEARGLATLFNNSSVLLCNGGCSLTVSGNMFTQGEIITGLAFSF